MIFTVDQKIAKLRFWGLVVTVPLFILSFLFDAGKFFDFPPLFNRFVYAMIVFMAGYWAYFQHKEQKIYLTQQVEISDTGIQYSKGSSATTFPFAEIISIQAERTLFFKSITIKNRSDEEMDLGSFENMDLLLDLIVEKMKLMGTEFRLKGGF